MKKRLIILILIILLVTVGVFMMLKKRPKEQTVVLKAHDYDIDLIQLVNNENKDNYMISPYSIEIALNMLKLGASGNTLSELEKVLPKHLTIINNDSVHIANALFIKNKYQSYIEKNYVKELKDKYNSDLLIDDFKTPKVINDWVNTNTKGMIPKLLDKISDEFALGLANAIAIDVKWLSQFECESTSEEVFTNDSNKKTKVSMMHKTYEYEDTSYFITDNAKGIIIPYEEKTNLEFVGILPNKDVDDYINKLSITELNDIDNTKVSANKKLHINLSLPRFSYDYSLKEFKEVLNKMDINDTFNSEKADFSKIISKENINKLGINNIYVDEAIHKTHIELNEIGTKAAAVTYFGFKAESSMIQEDYQTIDIKFNKTFIYIIRDKTNHNILFFGVVNTPNKWNGTTCKKESLS